MYSEERFIKCATYGGPDELPVLFSALPAAYLRYGRQLNGLLAKYPDIVGHHSINFEFERDCPPRYRKGVYTDDWGCVWRNERDGFDAIVRGHPIPDREGIITYEPPEALTGYLPHGFMYLRILDLRGFDEAMLDFAEEPEELPVLLEKITAANVRHVDALCRERRDRMLMFGDDLGMQNGLAIGAEKWRKWLKPCFKRIYDICRAYGRFVYMHTDGQIFEIMPDLQEAGVHMINPQYRANGLDNLVRVCKGKIPICLDLDRQLFPFATPAELKVYVEEVVSALWLKEGGLAINLEISPEVPLENIEALLTTLNALRSYTA